MDTIAIGYRIKELRKTNHLTQEKLAELLDVSTHFIYELESGRKKMSLDTLIQLVTALHTTADYLLFGTRTYCLSSYDQLSSLTDPLPAEQRNNIATILSVLIPLLNK